MKMDKKLSVCVMLTFSWLSVTAGLQCPSCTYLTTHAEIPSLARTFIETILGVFQDEECAQDLKGPIPQIQEETCEAITGQVPRCTFYKGSVTITIPLVLTSVDVPLNIYQRGCHHFKTANVPSTGCHKRDNINEDKTIIKQVLDKVSSIFEKYEVAKFDGEMCLCTDTYCRETSGVSQGVKLSTLSLCLSMLFCLFLHV